MIPRAEVVVAARCSRRTRSRGARRSCSARDARGSGFTLIELLIVLALMGLLLGIGVGVFARLDFSDRLAQATVQRVLRAAHNWSVARRAPALVRIDPRTHTIRAEGMSVIGTWHFENDALDGAFDVGGVRLGGRLIDDGFQGRALSFAGEPAGSRVDLPLHLDPACDVRGGFALRLCVRPSADAGGALLEFGESIFLETTDDGAVRGWIQTETVDDAGEMQPGGKALIDSGPDRLAPGRWSEVALVYDRRHLTVSVDGVECAALAEDAKVWGVDGALVLSPRSEPFPGAIDNVSVSVVGAEESGTLPSGVIFAAAGPTEIRFAAGGELDRAVHHEAVRLTLEFEDGRRVPVVVSLYGAVE